MAYTLKIPQADIIKIQLVRAQNNFESLASVKKRTGANVIFNGGFYNMKTGIPESWLVIDGKKLATGYCGYGYGITGNKVTFGYQNNTVSPHFIGAVSLLLKDGKRDIINHLSDLRGRTAMGLNAAGDLIVFVVPDVKGQAMYTTTGLADRMLSLGCVNAINLDGGGSSQIYCPDGEYSSGRAVSWWVCIWTKKENNGGNDNMKKVCLDPGHGAETAGKCSPDKSYYEHEFNLAIAKKMEVILARHGVAVTLTRKDTHRLSNTDTACLEKRVKIANAIKNLDLFVSLHSNASGDGWSSAAGYSIYTSVAGESANRNKAARAIIARVKAAGITMRGTPLLHKLLYVLRYTVAPAVLIEHGFHTNKSELELLKSDAYRDRLAEANCKGILDYLGIAWKETAKTADPNRERAKARFGFDDRTMAYLDGHPFPGALYKKLAECK